MTATDLHPQRWRLLGWGSALALLLLPAIAMRFTREVDWTVRDFAVMAVLLGATGLVAELLLRRAARRHRLLVIAGLLAAFLLVWGELAVGIVGKFGS